MQVTIQPSLDMPLPHRTVLEVEFDQPVLLYEEGVHIEVSDVSTHRFLYGEWRVDSSLVMWQDANPFVVFIRIPDYAFVPFAFYSVGSWVTNVILDYVERYCDSFSSRCRYQVHEFVFSE